MMRGLSAAERIGDQAYSSASPDLDDDNHAPDPALPSRGDISPRGWNVTAFRRSFPELWAQYLKETYRTAYAVQKAFPGIDRKTAKDWIGGRRDPSGSFVAIAVDRDPNAMEILGRTACP